MPMPPLREGVITEAAELTDLVSFTVLCRPASATAERFSLDEFRTRLKASDVDGLVPSEKTVAEVADRLRDLKFEVFDDRAFGGRNPRLAVFARGSVDLFQTVFSSTLVKVTRTVAEDGKVDRERSITSFVVAEGAQQPSTERIGS